jgi:hypothetical protein
MPMMVLPTVMVLPLLMAVLSLMAVAFVDGLSVVDGYAVIGDYAIVDGCAVVDGDAFIVGDTIVGGAGRVPDADGRCIGGFICISFFVVAFGVVSTVSAQVLSGVPNIAVRCSCPWALLF